MDEYESMIAKHHATIERIICRRQSVKGCYNGKPLTESVYSEGGTLNLEESRSNYLSDGTLADDGSIVCDACYVGF